MFGTPTHTEANLGIIEVHHTAHVNHSVTDRDSFDSPRARARGTLNHQPLQYRGLLHARRLTSAILMFGTPTHTEANLGIIEVHHTAHVNHSVTDRYATRSPVEAHLTRAHIAHDKPYAHAPHAPHAHDSEPSGHTRGRGRVPPTKKIRPLAHLTRAHIAHDKPYAHAPHAPHAHDSEPSGHTRGRGRVPPTKKIRPLVVLVLAVNASQDFLNKA